MANKLNKKTTILKSSINVTSKKQKKVTINDASTFEDIGLNKTQAKTIGTMFTKENMGPHSISKILGIPRRKVMKTLEIQKHKTYSAGSYK